jgi:hypothetical protein|tara:strand:- start:3184 stop:3369 length:186 start_codon:yes stop_codon:yes gene_type:complete
MNELELLKRYNDEFRDQAVGRLISGGAKDYAEYRELIGVIRGLDHANASLFELKRRLETDD